MNLKNRIKKLFYNEKEKTGLHFMLDSLYCNLCDMPITKGMIYYEHKDGTVLCKECYEMCTV